MFSSFFRVLVVCGLGIHTTIVHAWSSSSTTTTTTGRKIPFFAKPSSSSPPPRHDLLPPTTTTSGCCQPNIHILILPGFATCTRDYTQPGSLVSNLQGKISPNNIHVLPIQRYDWFHNTLAKGMTDWKFLAGIAEPNGPAYGWYLQRVATEIRRIVADNNNNNGEQTKIVLVGHSAGGWLARAAVGYGSRTTRMEEESSSSSSSTEPQQCEIQVNLDHIAGIVTLGSPHVPCPQGAMDITRGALRHVDKLFPGAYFKDQMFYITAAGNAIQGSCEQCASSLEVLAYQSYRLVSGIGKNSGDGVTPTAVAHLPGAWHVTMENVLHAQPMGSTWYGSAVAIDAWLAPMFQYLSSSSV